MSWFNEQHDQKRSPKNAMFSLIWVACSFHYFPDYGKFQIVAVESVIHDQQMPTGLNNRWSEQ